MPGCAPPGPGAAGRMRSWRHSCTPWSGSPIRRRAGRSTKRSASRSRARWTSSATASARRRTTSSRWAITASVLELTLNHDGRTYELGTGYGHIAVGVDDLDGALAEPRGAGHRARAPAVPGARGRLLHRVRSRSRRLQGRAHRAGLTGLSIADERERAAAGSGSLSPRRPPARRSRGRAQPRALVSACCSAASVFGPTTPSAPRPWAFWKAWTADFVPGPYWPSIVPIV